MNVKETVSLNASAETVWSYIGDFDRLDAWHPAVAASRIEGSGDGRIRHLTLGDGATIIERFDEHNAAARRYTYTIIDPGPLPVRDYQSTIEVSDSGSSATVTWSSTFEAEGAPDADAKGAITGVYTGGFAALTEKYGAA